MWQGTDEFDSYFLWLGALVDVDWSRYSELLYILDNIEFRWSLPQDESRATEGLLLREEFVGLDPTQDWVAFMDSPCSVLEALIPIARRMDDILMDEGEGNRTRVWFWELIENLGLKPYNNARLVEHLYGVNDDYDIQMIVGKWLDREFDRLGHGSIFPIPEEAANKVLFHDQRAITIIYQMNEYLAAVHGG